MKKDHLFLVFIGIVIAMFICMCSIVKDYVHISVKYEKAVNYINALEADFPDYIDITAESDEYYEYYNF
mgnify:CR=1 FL=1